MMNNYRYEEIYYYSLADLLGENSGNNYSDIDASTNIMDMRNFLGWNDIPNSVFTILNDPITQTLWIDFILPRYWKSIVGKGDKEYNFQLGEGIEEVYGEFYRLFESILLKTYKRYSHLISIYEENEANLMKQLESSVSSKSRDNDVPQTSVTDPYDSKFANHSSVGDVVTKTDYASIPQKLEEIRKMWYSIYEEWCNNFAPLFLELRGN